MTKTIKSNQAEVSNKYMADGHLMNMAFGADGLL